MIENLNRFIKAMYMNIFETEHIRIYLSFFNFIFLNDNYLKKILINKIIMNYFQNAYTYIYHVFFVCVKKFVIVNFVYLTR